MKKLYSIFAVLALAFLVASPAYALQCKAGNYEASDACWTDVKVSSSETTPVTAGMVLVYDFSSSEDANDAAYQVRVLTATTQSSIIAGVAQKTIATGDSASVLVRGKGQVYGQGAVTSGDALFVAETADGYLRSAAEAGTRDRAIAFALETDSDGGLFDAYITVV